MMTSLQSMLILTIAFGLTSPLPAQEQPVALRGAVIHTVSGPVIENGTLIVSGGKVLAVGSADAVKIPAQTEVRDVSGLVIIPGLVDSHSHLGVYARPQVPAHSDGNEMTSPVQSLGRAIDAIHANDPGIRMAQAGGVTTANIMPGSGNVIGGQTVYVKLRGRTIDEMRIEADGVLGGLKMANGENPKRAYGGKNQAPMTRMKVAALQRAEFIKAREYMRKWQRYREQSKTDQEASPPDLDLALEPLVEVLEGRRTVHFHSHRADDILTVLRLKDEFGFELVLQHGTESYKVIPEVAKAKVPVSMTIVDSPGGKAEVVDFIEACGAELSAAGVPVHVNTDDPVTESRFLLRTAAATVRGGLDEATALKAITLYPAQALHLAHRVGSLQAGRDADFVILSGAPFSVYTRVLETWIDGQPVFRLADEQQRLFQTGGFALGDSSRVPGQKDLIQPRAPAVDPAGSENHPRATADHAEFIVHGGRLHTAAGAPIEDGAVHVKEGRIVFAGPRRELKAPVGLPVLTAREVTPGLIDAHTVVPLSGEYNIAADQDQDERTDPLQPDARVLDAFHPGEPLLRFLLEQGVTVVHATPGHANVIAGLTGVFRTHGTTAEGMTVRFPQSLMINLGEEPKGTYSGKVPATRMGTAGLIRRSLQAAANYQRKQQPASKKDEDSKNNKPGPDFDPGHEALGLALQRKIPAFFTAHRSDDILTALRLADEFQLQPILGLATEGYLITDRLAAAKVPVIAHPPMQRVGGMQTYHSFLGNAAALADAGVPVALCSSVEAYVPKTRVVRWESAIGMTYGLGFDRALRSITIDSARILGIDRDHGSLEAGKVADLVLYDGDPFEHPTHVTHVVSQGRLVHTREAKRRQLLVMDRSQVNCPEPGCCAGY